MLFVAYFNGKEAESDYYDYRAKTISQISKIGLLVGSLFSEETRQLIDKFTQYGAPKFLEPDINMKTIEELQQYKK